MIVPPEMTNIKDGQPNPLLQGTQATKRPNVPKKKFQGKKKSKQINSTGQGKTAQGSPAKDNASHSPVGALSQNFGSGGNRTQPVEDPTTHADKSNDSPAKKKFAGKKKNPFSSGNQ